MAAATSLPSAACSMRCWLESPPSAKHNGDNKKAQAILDEAMSLPRLNDEDGEVILTAIRVELFERRPEAALARLAQLRGGVYSSQFAFIPADLLAAQAHLQAGRPADAQAASARAQATIRLRLAERPEDARLYDALGVALAGLGRGQEALQRRAAASSCSAAGS